MSLSREEKNKKYALYREVLDRLVDSNFDEKDISFLRKLTRTDIHIFAEDVSDPRDCILLFFDIVKQIEDEEIINAFLKEQDFVNAIQYKFKNYRYAEELSKEAFNFSLLNDVVIVIFSKENHNKKLIVFLFECFKLIKDVETRILFKNMQDAYYKLYYGSELDRKSIDFLGGFFGSLLEFSRRQSWRESYKDHKRIYLSYIFLLSQIDYHAASAIVYIGDDNDYFTKNRNVELMAYFSVRKRLDLFKKILELNNKLKINLFDKNEIIEGSYWIFRKRKDMEVSESIYLLEYILDNIEEKGNFINKCLWSTTYRNIITEEELNCLDRYIVTVENNEKLVKKSERLRERIKRKKDDLLNKSIMEKKHYEEIMRSTDIDTNAIAEAKEVLKHNQEKLVIDVPDIDSSLAVEQQVEDDDSYSPVQKNIIRAILNKEDAEFILDQYRCNLVLEIEKINEISIADIGDTLIEEINSEYVIYEEYIDYAKGL